MDIVTHSLIGLIGASPLIASQPWAAVGFVYGSVLPDLDALSRVFGKQTFIACHQTWTHSLPVIALVGLLTWATGLFAGAADEGLGLAVGLVLGMTLHSLLDYTNTLGIALLLPFSRRRYCLEWVFFLDAVVMVASVAALAAVLPALVAGREVGWWAPAIYASAMAGYWLLKAALRFIAGRRAPADTQTILPSALIPWQFLGCRQTGDTATLFRLDLLTGRATDYAQHTILDAAYQDLLTQVPEFALMRGLSPAYHLVEAAPRSAGLTLKCRDLRTRNFSTRYGDLDIDVDSAGAIERVDFHA